jgi:hypothetical protein
MRKNLFTLLATSTLLVALGWLTLKPIQTLAAEIVSITPDATDITDQLSDGAPADVTMFGWVGTVDQDYTAVIAVNEEPVLLITPGATIDPTNPWVYDETAGTVTVAFTLKGLIDDTIKGLPAGSGVGIVAMIGATSAGNGPPAEMTGGWLSTNLQEWEIIPPSEKQVAFGFNLTGPSGTTGYFRMFLPETLIDLLSNYSGQSLTVDDLAVFVDDQQASLSVTEINGGAYIDINITFSEASTVVAADSVTKKIVTAPQLSISLAAKKTTVSKGSDARLYGWINQAKANKTITLYRKLKNEKTYSVWKTIKTDNDGYFSAKYKASKTASYKAKYKDNSSETVKVTVDS